MTLRLSYIFKPLGWWSRGKHICPEAQAVLSALKTRGNTIQAAGLVNPKQTVAVFFMKQPIPVSYLAKTLSSHASLTFNEAAQCVHCEMHAVSIAHDGGV